MGYSNDQIFLYFMCFINNKLKVTDIKIFLPQLNCEVIIKLLKLMGSVKQFVTITSCLIIIIIIIIYYRGWAIQFCVALEKSAAHQQLSRYHFSVRYFTLPSRRRVGGFLSSLAITPLKVLLEKVVFFCNIKMVVYI